MKAPAFQFYPKDYQTDVNVVLMSLEERGAYVDLLCYCWTNGAIPADKKSLARLLGVTSRKLESIWPAIEPCFRSDGDGHLTHPRLDKERRKQAENRLKKQKAGRASAEARQRGNT